MLQGRYSQSLKIIEELTRGGEGREGSPDWQGLAEGLRKLEKRLGEVRMDGPQPMEEDEFLELLDHTLKNQEKLFKKIGDLQMTLYQRNMDGGFGEAAKVTKKAL